MKLFAVIGVAAMFCAVSLQAQETTVELGASVAHARPPAGELPSADYGLANAMLRIGTVDATGLDLYGGTGAAASSNGVRWIEGNARGRLLGSCALLRCALRGEGFGIRYPGSTAYRAFGARVNPEVRLPVGITQLRLSADATRGQWRRDVLIPGTGTGLPLDPRPTSQTKQTSGDLSLFGGTAGFGVSARTVWFEPFVDWHKSDGGAHPGSYAGGGVEVAAVLGSLTLSAGARAQNTPLGQGAGYHAGFILPIGNSVEVRAQVGRTLPDALYGAPAALMTSVGVALVLGRSARHTQPVAEVLAKEESGRRVRFTYRGSATSVAVAGDFNSWKTLPLMRVGNLWRLEVVIPAGVHHYAFLVNENDWRVPEGAAGVIDDGFGRKNATVVVQ